MKWGWYKFSLLFFVLLSIESCGQDESNVLEPVPFYEKIQELKDPIIIDVRTPQEFQGGHIKDAINIDWKDSSFDDHIAMVDQSRPVLVYCLSGGRSGAAAEKMRTGGFSKVYELNGGMLSWRTKGLPETGNNVAKGITSDKYHDLVSSQEWILVDFYADWCAPCKKMKPFLEKIKNEMEPELKVIRLNADENRLISSELKVQALPDLKLYQSGKLVWEHTGFLSESKLIEVMRHYGIER